MGFTRCEVGRKTVSTRWAFKMASSLGSIPDLREDGGVADAISVEVGSLGWDVVVHIARLHPCGQRAHVVLPGPGGPVVEPQSWAVRPACTEHDRVQNFLLSFSNANNADSPTCFLVWIVVVDFQPIKHVLVLASDGNTCVFWKLVRLTTVTENPWDGSSTNRTTWRWTFSYPSPYSPDSHHSEAGVPHAPPVALPVGHLGHVGGAAVQQHVVNQVVVLNVWLHLRGKEREGIKRIQTGNSIMDYL